ncbi:hypothetical protein [Fimbriiglobus ruber]|uniref:Uncharacterized protein n=1 Tax=Fimbriiglobus ruber TaxID=1908690 RepID=A0A225E1N7_9BACT|nr:hypothetical protein [Fimbriiglobus ruber]OWK45694.1 hypothetical protein FRUB_02025 [Fimbriiglobus ruber]
MPIVTCRKCGETQKALEGTQPCAQCGAALVVPSKVPWWVWAAGVVAVLGLVGIWQRGKIFRFGDKVATRAADALEKPSPDREGVEWTYGSLAHYLRTKKLDFAIETEDETDVAKKVVGRKAVLRAKDGRAVDVFKKAQFKLPNVRAGEPGGGGPYFWGEFRFSGDPDLVLAIKHALE